ncbi:MAG: glycosyltransferase, partial [Atribacterota bacterium]|nr:glycosyltransferase [Atribacterota bacterium]
HFVFVSNWLYQMFLKFFNIEFEKIDQRKQIIYNSVGKKFEKNVYDSKSEKVYDFITIRNNLDGSKYAIDIVAKIAKINPKYIFCVIGKGNYFKYNEKPKNIVWIDKSLNHDEILIFLNKSTCALLPTRADAQGVMACELATFGIPLITSDIDVSREIFIDFENVEFIDNKADKIDIEPLYQNLINRLSIEKKIKRNKKYFSENTILKEIKLFEKIIN